LLSRGNVSDSLLVLLLVLAADATAAALLSGSLRQLLLAGVWVGLAFQAKMIQAWLVLPALAAGYLLAAPAARLRTRCAHVVLAGPFAADGGWLLPAAVADALGALISRRGRGRRDPLRAAVVLWGGWWLVLAVFFSAGTFINSYYVAALVPAVAALCGTGIAA